MLATAAVRYRPDWQPDPFACIAAGVVATAVLLAALVSIFSRQPQSDLQAAAVKIRIGPVTDARSMAVKKILQPRHRTGRLAQHFAALIDAAHGDGDRAALNLHVDFQLLEHAHVLAQADVRRVFELDQSAALLLVQIGRAHV